MAGYTEERHDINGIDTAVLTAGEGEPLVFLHGAGTAMGFDALLPMAGNARLIVPYHPGFGASADDPSIDGLHDYILHYLDLFDRLGIDKVSLVGHSMGGNLAATFALLYPQRVRRLVLAAPFGLRVPEHPTVDFFSIPDEQVLEYLVADLTPYADMPMPPPPEFLADRYRESTSFARVAWKRPYDLKLQKWLHRIAAPTLIVWGEADRLIPVAQAPIWAEHIAGAQVRTLPGIGHLVFDESPDAAAAVRDFLGTGVTARTGV
jgi:pimeloyl-ACP methyl ester carboxylesterase